MALSARDIWIIIRARDIASRTILESAGSLKSLGAHAASADKALYRSGQQWLRLGRITTAVGIGIGVAGVTGALAIKKMTDASMEFEKSAALAATQVHNGRVSAQELEKISIGVAKSIPVPIESLNKSLFDIFSSTDIKVKDSKKVLTEFSVAAVAGQDDIISVGRTAISILNAFDEPLSNLNHIFDIQFKMVQLGVGTYSQFAGVLGRAIPSVRAAGQSFTFLAGAMAFLTRRGLSTAMASVGIARLTDMFRRPQTFKGLANLGSLALDAAKSVNQKLTPATTQWLKGFKVSLLDAQGHMRPINVLLAEMAPAFAKLRAPARAGLFKDVFGAQGTIQARRFFDLAIDHTKQLNRFIKDVGNSAGSTRKAFDRMASTLAAKSQLLHNNWEILKIQLGTALIPYVAKFVTQLTKLVQWFNNLSPHTKDLIAKFLVWGTVITLIAGVLLTLGGAVMMFTGGLQMMAAKLGFTVLKFLLFSGVIGLIIAVVIVLAIVIIKYHKQIWAFLVRMWNDVSRFVIRIWNDIYNAIDHALGNAYHAILNVWHALYVSARDVWGAIEAAIFAVWHAINIAARDTWGAVRRVIFDVWHAINIAAGDAWGAILAALKAVWKVIRITFAVFLALLLLPWTTLWSVFGDRLKASWHDFLNFLKIIWHVIASFFQQQWAVAVVLWTNLWNSFKIIGVAFWHAINTAFRFVWLQIKKFFMDQWAIAVILWRNLWESFKIIGIAFWHAINIAFRFVWLQIKQFFVNQWAVAVTLWNNLWESFKIIGKNAWKDIKTIFTSAWNVIFRFFKNQITPFKQLWSGFVDSLKTIWDRVKGIFTGPVNWIIDHVLNPFIRTLDRISSSLGVALKIPQIPNIGGGGGGRSGSGAGGSAKFRASGGYIIGPGGPRADAINAWLSNGEFVVNAAATARHRQVLEAINSNRFARGGIVGAVTDPVGTAINLALHRLPGGGAVSRLISGMAHKFISAIGDAIKKKIGALFTGPGNVIAGAARPPRGLIQAYAMTLLNRRGWGSMWNSFNALEMGEAGWNPFAQNPTSSAFGLGQFLDSTWASVGGHKTSDFRLQLEYMMRYIARVYGNPARAYSAWASRSPHWYRGGGFVRPYKGFANGGMINEPIYGIGRSGTRYAFGERGPETVTPGGKGPTQNFYITTQEIDPRRHAQQLGWELSLR